MFRSSFQDGLFKKDDRPFFLIGTDYQYYRSRKKDWKKHLVLLRRAHVNTITFYVPWRHHLIGGDKNLNYDFSGKTKDSRDLEYFLSLCSELGFYMIAKPGPFVHSELNIGGLPDIASPSFNSKIEPVRDWKGKPLVWQYDQTSLPSSEDPLYDALARHWLENVGGVLKPRTRKEGKLIAVQLNDETLYCTSNSPPWAFGYDEPGLIFYRRLLEKKYRSIEQYNQTYKTSFKDFSQVPVPKLGEELKRKEDLLRYIDWAEYQWKIRRESFSRYKKYLGLDLPALSNFAGITPPIEENIPRKKKEALPEVPAKYRRLYSDWWLAQNRLEADREIYHYGFISWLGVAAYGISDPKTTNIPPDPEKADEVFQRYVNTAGRRRGINMEENWGFAKLYHPFSKFPVIPFFQTLVSVAAGASGYAIYCGVQHDYWEDDLDRMTKKQWPVFPSDAPITPEGKKTPMYETMALLNRWFEREGEKYLKAVQDPQLCWLIYPPYAAVSGWIPQDRIQGRGGELEVPRSGVDGFEPLAKNLQRAGYVLSSLELDSVSQEELNSRKACALRTGFFMDEKSQKKLIQYVSQGGVLIACGPIPEMDLKTASCSLLKSHVRGEASKIGKGFLYRSESNLFKGPEILFLLERIGLKPRMRTGKDLRAFIYRRGQDFYIWFFYFGSKPAQSFVEFYGRRLDLTVGSKASGVVHLSGKRVKSVLFKGKNEVEGITSKISVSYCGKTLSHNGDFLKFF